MKRLKNKHTSEIYFLGFFTGKPGGHELVSTKEEWISI